jgi:Ca2+-binding RTX toxin-like protein
VTVGDNNAGATDTLTITLGGAGGTLSGMGLSGGAGGNYELTGTAAAITGELDALVFTPKAGAANRSSTTTFTLVDLSSAYATPAVDSTTSVIDRDPAVAPPSPPPAPLSPPPLSVEETTLNQSLSPSFQAYTGPVADIQHEYLNLGVDSFNITAATPNWFIHSGSGNDAIAVSSGTNVLDGGTGSNFLTGGSGADTFFVDDRGPTADIWSTVNNFHAGDAATIWGVTPQDYSLDWVDGQGAAGYTGLTLHAMAPGLPTASLTLVRFYAVGSPTRAPFRLLWLVER